MAVQTSAGIKLSISSSLPATNDESGFDALADFDLIGEVESIDAFGITYNNVEFTALDNRRVRKFKGSYDPGTPGITLAIDRSDAGQTTAKAALDSDSDYSFKIEYQDGSIDYYVGKVMSFTTNPGGVDNIVMGNMTIGINDDPVEVAAT